MSKDTRFKPGQSGNPKGRPKKETPRHISAFEIVLDKTLAANLGGRERQLTVDEALQQQTLKGALAGNRTAIRKVLRMIAQRDAALTKKEGAKSRNIKVTLHQSADNANEAMRILGIANRDPSFEGKRRKVHAWATQAALSRPGRKTFDMRERREIEFFTFESETLHWPRGRIA